MYICVLYLYHRSAAVARRGKGKNHRDPIMFPTLFRTQTQQTFGEDDVYVIYILTSFSNPKEKKKNKSAQKKRTLAQPRIVM